jgi:hypothetical protein
LPPIRPRPVVDMGMEDIATTDTEDIITEVVTEASA